MRILTPFVALIFALVAFLVVVAAQVSAQSSRGDEHGNVGNARGKQSEVDSLQHELVRAMQALEHEFALKKVPILQERNKFLNTVPGFWQRALTNHPNFGHIAHGEDAKILEHLTSLDIDEINPQNTRLPDGSDAVFESQAGNEAPPHQQHASTKYLVRLAFDSNPYFTDKLVWRVVDSYSSDVSRARTSGVNWMPGQRSTTASFFQFFEQPGAHEGGHVLTLHRVLDIAHLLRYEIYANPFTYFDIPTYADMAAEESKRREVLMRQQTQDEEELMAQYQQQDDQERGESL